MYLQSSIYKFFLLSQTLLHGNVGEFMFVFQFLRVVPPTKDSNRKVFLPDLKLDFAQNPEESGPRGQNNQFKSRTSELRDVASSVDKCTVDKCIKNLKSSDTTIRKRKRNKNK
jgi:hypothetical protein